MSGPARRRGAVLLRSRVARRLLWSFLVCAGLPIVALGALTFVDVSRGLRTQSEARLHAAAKSSGLLLLDRLATIRGYLQAAAAGSDPRGWAASGLPMPPGAGDLLLGASLVSADGRAQPLRGGPLEPPAGLATADERGVLAPGATAAPPELLFGFPLSRAAGAPRIVTAISAARLLGEVMDPVLPPRVEYCVLAGAGLVLGCSRDGLAAALPRGAPGHAGAFTVDLDETAYFGMRWTLFLDAQLEAESWTVFLLEPQASALAALARFRLLFPWLSLACLGVVFLLSVQRIRRQMEPLDRLESAARRVGSGRFDVALRIEDDDEFGALAGSFNTMASRLAGQFELLRGLIELDREVLSAHDERAIAGALRAGLGRVHPCAGVAVLLSEGDPPRRYAGWLERSADRQRTRVTLERGPELDALLRRPERILDLDLAGPEGAVLAPLGEVRRACVLPLEDAAGPIGLVVLADPARDGAAPPPDPAIARQVADQAAVAIVNARTEERNRFLAQRDALTGLANRALFQDRLEQALAAARRQGGLVGVCLIDLDRFKGVNDGLGHAAGDRLLQQVATRLRRHAPRGSLARMGGDEFTLLLPGVASPEACSSLLGRMLEDLAQPFALDGREIFVTASAGIALHPLDGASGEDLLRYADAAMYESKRQGGNRIAFYTAALSERAHRRLRLESALRRAVERDEIVPFYQPLAEIGSREWVGFEVLSRWTSPELGPVSPADFIPVAEEIGLIGALGESILRRACRQAQAWQQEHRRALRVSVNLSVRQLRDPELATRVAAILEETGLDPGLLVLELTESELMEDAERGRERLALLRRLGVRISIDDFGTGYSSLGYLQSFPIDHLKIDRRFLGGIGAGGVDDAIVGAIVGIGHALGLVVVAEGVERETQRAALERLGCDLVQGWLLAPALPAEEVGKQLALAGDP